ncbi:RimK family alpha-L-glutamate ligase [Nocardia sp. NPDC052566]|uniref:RimK family alpha-L-glutamate ligase n=1 Tax=Nocardia sp. NPDC052566 TaxID=3364330 RepID=UPI0037C6E74A
MVAARMRFCFLVEEQYRREGMPLAVVRQLRAWGHRVDVLRPGGELLDLNSLIQQGDHDAWVLKTVSGGPGLGLLEAAAAAGLTTINDARSIRGVRDKTQAAVRAARSGLPVPATWAASRLADLAQIPSARFPLVVKPADGSSGRSVHLVEHPEQLFAVAGEFAGEGQLIAQPWVPNTGVDLKVYSAGGRLYGTERRSPLAQVDDRPEAPVPLSAEVAEIAAKVGEVFGLDLYGVDIVLGPDGPVVVDVNDFPSFRQVPRAAATVARAIIDLARAGAGWHDIAESRLPAAVGGHS